MSAVPELSLPRFEGPLDLLLDLVRRNEVAITDIPIAEVTRQYLDYLHRAEELNIDLGSEFVYFAALLIHIKSKSLLPAAPDLGPAEPDPREELIRKLMDHEQLQQGASFLRQKLELAEVMWSRSMEEDLPPPDTTGELRPALNLLQVLQLARQALEAARTYDLVTPADPVSVEDMMRWLGDRMARSTDTLEGTALLAEQPDAAHRNALFLAMLEMARSSAIFLDQSACFGPISIRTV